MTKFYCEAYDKGCDNDIRFVVRAETNADAIAEAKAEAMAQGRNSVFVELGDGSQIYDGAVTPKEA